VRIPFKTFPEFAVETGLMLHEIKFDGYRVQVHVDKGKRRLTSAFDQKRTCRPLAPEPSFDPAAQKRQRIVRNGSALLGLPLQVPFRRKRPRSVVLPPADRPDRSGATVKVLRDC
jgi:hypothetical protein